MNDQTPPGSHPAVFRYLFSFFSSVIIFAVYNHSIALLNVLQFFLKLFVANSNFRLFYNNTIEVLYFNSRENIIFYSKCKILVQIELRNSLKLRSSIAQWTLKRLILFIAKNFIESSINQIASDFVFQSLSKLLLKDFYRNVSLTESMNLDTLSIFLHFLIVILSNIFLRDSDSHLCS